MVIPVLVLVLLAGLWAVGAATGRMRCQDAAHEAARALARGESEGAAAALAARLAPAGARVTVDREPPLVRVTVRAAVRPLGTALRLPGLPVSADAVAADEAALPVPAVLPAGNTHPAGPASVRPVGPS